MFRVISNFSAAYSPVLDLFSSFLDLASEPNLLRKVSQEAQHSRQLNNSLNHLQINGIGGKSSSVRA